MKFLIDANVCILLFSAGSARLRERVEACDAGDIGISAIAFAEVAFGSWRGKKPSLQIVTNLQAVFPILPFDESAARRYAPLPFKRASFDRLIAAHAIALDLTLITNNERDFADIPGLKVENWARL